MKTNSPSKFQSIVAIVVFTLSGIGALAVTPATLAAAAPPAPSASAQSPTYPQNYFQPTPETKCLDWVEKLATAASKMKTISRSLGSKYASCLGERVGDGERSYVEGLTGLSEKDEEERQGDSCANYKSSCSVLDGVDTADILKTARQDYNEAQTNMLKMQQESKETQKKLDRTMKSIQQSLVQAEREYRLQLDAIQKELDAKIKGADQELRKAVSELRTKITAKRNDLTSINDGVRQAENAVANAKTGWEAGCRTEAYQKYESVKAEIKKAAEEKKTKGTKVNYSNSNLAGASNRKEDKDKRRMQADYANGYKECIAGVSGAGAAAKQALESANVSLKSAIESAAERRTTLEKEIKDLMSDYADMQTSTAENKDTLRKSIESRISAANIAYQNAVEKANLAYSHAQEDLSDAIQFGQANNQIAVQNAQATQMEYINAQNIQKCSGSSTMSKSAQDRVVKQIGDYESAQIDRESVCSSQKTCTGTKSEADVANACKDGSSKQPAPQKPAVGGGADSQG